LAIPSCTMSIFLSNSSISRSCVGILLFAKFRFPPHAGGTQVPELARFQPD
jgi:hypothetical protein